MNYIKGASIQITSNPARATAARNSRGKSMLAPSATMVVFALREYAEVHNGEEKSPVELSS